MQDAAHILTGLYELRNTSDIFQKFLILMMLLSLEFTLILEEYEDVLVNVLDELHTMKNRKFATEVTASITRHLSGSFETGKFQNLRGWLQIHTI